MKKSEIKNLNNILADLLLTWEKRAPHILLEVLKTNERLDDVMNDAPRCKRVLADLIKKKSDMKVIDRQLRADLPY